MRARLILLATLTFASVCPRPAGAGEPLLIGPDDGPEGRPQVVLDELVVPANLSDHQRVSKLLTRLLKHEARRVKWGAGRQNRITYRFYLEDLSLSQEGGVLKVRCSALGRLPGGKTARSKLEFGGDPREAQKIVDHVLLLVSRGVLSRLADLERTRRSRR